MKVVIAHNRYSSAQPSGENVIVDYEIDALSRAGVEVVPFLRSSDEIADFSPVQKASLVTSPIHSRSTQRELAELFERERPDILHLHNVYPLLSPAVIETAHRHGVKVVQTIHNYRHDCINGLYFRDGHDCHDCHGKRWNAPGVRHACYRGSRAQSAIMATALGRHRDTWRSVDRFIALTTGMSDYLKSIGMRDDQIRVKPNAIADPGSPHRLGEGFFFAARLVEEKGVRLLLDAWDKVDRTQPGMSLTIAGDGPMRNEVEAAAEAGMINYVGSLNRDEVADRLRTSAAVVIPSIWEDVLPTSGLEALAAGRAVLATRMGGAPYIAGVDAENPAGTVTDTRPEALAEGFQQVHDRVSDYAQAARRRYEEVFAPPVVLRRLIEIYEELAE
ncbi:glycosyltransferase family 4 protein [Haloglycomyces albus]|uniref:glycosyltransferase family 4 protein n=1 Tax=Haloglycomyces albus TaxID=526067 RepID=UPI00046C9E65|nr:glycosyltransferase family 4 protein [Haloglycomyces albus]